MGLSLLQSVKVGAYVMKHRIKGTPRYPLVLMLEPLFRCNLECAGCGKIQYPEDILKKRLSVQECIEAVEESGVPVVSIPGGEPLIHPDMPQIVDELVKRKKFVYLCSNAILLERRLHEFKPSKYLTFSIHLDGVEKTHDRMVCREGVFKTAVSAIRAAKAKGFRVTTNSTVFDGENADEFHEFFDFLTNDLKTDGIMISPGYAYQKAPDQEHFLRLEKSRELMRQILRPSLDKVSAKRQASWQFNQSPFFIDFLVGEKDYQCTPWGSPCRNVFGWQRPCYLLQDGYAKTFKELMETTDWDAYGRGRDPRCADCMVHCGYEPSAVLDSTANFKNMWKSLKDALGFVKPGASAATRTLTDAPALVRKPLVELPVLDAKAEESDRDAVGASRN
jgi:hopanoid biosynthesis associated radical SAM protein HpnH